MAVIEGTDPKKLGSVSIEAAIVIPLFCFFVFALVGILQHVALYAVTANSCLSVAEKLEAYVSIFYRSGLDSLDESVKNAAADVLPSDGFAGDVVSLLAGEALDKIESSVWAAVLKPAVEEEIKKETDKLIIPLKVNVDSLICSSFFERGTEYKLCVTTSSDYLFPNVFTRKKGIILNYTVSGNGWIYGGNPRYSVDDINVWELSNFKRGKVLETVYGSNLPEFFPVIDIVDRRTGIVTMLVSVDATAPTYDSEEKLRKTVYKNAKKLRDFNGGELEGVSVDEGEIKKRKIILILPDNVSDPGHANELFEIQTGCLLKYGIEMEISFYQHSYVYEKDNGEG